MFSFVILWQLMQINLFILIKDEHPHEHFLFLHPVYVLYFFAVIFFFNLLTDLQLFLFDRMWVYERERSGHFKIWPLLPSGGSGCEKLRSGI